MTRIGKVLGFIVVAALAITAVVAPAARAEHFTAESYPATLHGEQVSGESEVFTTEGGSPIECEKSTFASSLSAASEELIEEPTEENCHITVLGVKLDITTTNKGCDWDFTLSGIADLVCETGKDRQVHVYNGVNVAHTEANELCRYTILAQKAEGAVSYVNMTKPIKDITIKKAVKSIAVSRAFGSLVNCGPINQIWTWTGSSTVTAVNGKGVSIGLDVG